MKFVLTMLTHVSCFTQFRVSFDHELFASCSFAQSLHRRGAGVTSFIAQTLHCPCERISHDSKSYNSITPYPIFVPSDDVAWTMPESCALANVARIGPAPSCLLTPSIAQPVINGAARDML